MAFENRNGRSYYYRKKRSGNRVVSEYIGRGKVAELIALSDEIEHAKNTIAREKEKETRKKYENIEEDLTEIESKIKIILESFLIANGFYRSRSREWRKKQNGKNDNC